MNISGFFDESRLLGRQGFVDFRKEWDKLNVRIDELCHKIVENPEKYAAFVIQDEIPYAVPVLGVLAAAEHDFVHKMNVKFRVGDVVAYRTCDDNDSEWKSFTIRLVEGGYLYEREDKTGDNIAIECAHKVMVHN